METAFQDIKPYIIALMELLIEEKITEEEFWKLAVSLHEDIS
jgi:hypothetical protein